ncbi:PA2169 family four-helix-bundle protein [Qipengyuania sp. GH38]|uniref:ferritin-like domain-containing protein n=1 Tax=Qipengyuania intermedia TaxID=2867244 RepID=UPI001C87B8A8|nr:PA2169 family four-helix-bundle protein [Qipengyuania intermedia]MBX7514895.1 PA2169 family four-helix-bundle protein [Qipengyuania intermedia]
MSSTVFKSLTDTTFDSVEGYRQAGEKADSPQLKQALQQRCQSREQTLQQMNAELQRQGDELVTKGTMTGEAHQMWQSITSAFENNDEAAAERVEEGEDYIKGKFEQALESDQLEAQERAIVQQAYAEICEGERFGDMIAKQYD